MGRGGEGKRRGGRGWRREEKGKKERGRDRRDRGGRMRWLWLTLERAARVTFTL